MCLLAPYISVDVELLENKLTILNTQIEALKCEAMSQTKELDDMLDVYESGVRSIISVLLLVLCAVVSFVVE